jgi:DNA polymerase-3 subunit beta
MKVEEGSLKLSTTNLEMAVSAVVRGRVDQPGEYTVPAKLLQDYVSLLSSGKVELALTEEGLRITADDKTTTIKGMPASEFPVIPKLAREGAYRFQAEVLKQAIGQVAFAVSSSESRPELSGVSCVFHGEGRPDTLLMAATDSYRLSERVVPLVVGGNGKTAKSIVPARALGEIGRILSAYKDDVGVPEVVEWSITESQLVLSYGNVELVSRLIEGSFPDYRPLIPQQFRSNFTVSRVELAKAIRAASLFARQGIYDILFEIKDAGVLSVSSSDSGTGAHTTMLKGQLEGEVNKVTLNFKYVSDG